jgi:hypothetical protein
MPASPPTGWELSSLPLCQMLGSARADPALLASTLSCTLAQSSRCLTTSQPASGDPSCSVLPGDVQVRYLAVVPAAATVQAQGALFHPKYFAQLAHFLALAKRYRFAVGW